MRENTAMKIRYALIPVLMVLCISSSVATGISPGSLSNTRASGMEPVIPVIPRPPEVPVIESGTVIAIIHDMPELYRVVLPVPAIEAPVSSPGVLFQELLPCGQSLRLPEPVPVPVIPSSYPSLSTPVDEQGTVTVQPWGRPVSGTGTIRWIDLEGGFFGIESDDGAHYLALNLGEAYRVDGMRIWFSADPADGMTYAMWGMPVTLISVEGENNASTGVLITYHRTGGIAGFQDDLTVYENGSARISRMGGVRVIQLNSKEFDAIRDASDETGFLMLSREYLPGGEGRDLFFYEITMDGRTVLTADTAVPEELVPLIELLNGIVARVSPR